MRKVNWNYITCSKSLYGRLIPMGHSKTLKSAKETAKFHNQKVYKLVEVKEK